MCTIMRKITRLICACAIYKGCGPSARLELPPDNFSRNAPGVGCKKEGRGKGGGTIRQVVVKWARLMASSGALFVQETL